MFMAAPGDVPPGISEQRATHLQLPNDTKLGSSQTPRKRISESSQGH